MFKSLVVCPRNLSLCPLVNHFPNLSLKELVALKDTPKEAKYGGFCANAHNVVCMYFPPKAGLFRSLEGLSMIVQDE